MGEVFLSYSSEDRRKAAVLASRLQEAGFSVWWDRDIPAGRTFDRLVEEALDAAQCVVVLWSPSSVRSRWVRAEAEEGARRRVLLPALIEEAAIPLSFRQIQAADLLGWDGAADDAGYHQLVSDITKMLGRDDLAPTVPRHEVASSEQETVETSSSAAQLEVSGYRILGRLGEGGMGEVYKAEQLEPVRREVAVKVIKWGMDTKEVLARFESERQALALMDHPAIARVFEAGATESGRPYFAMELVQGVPVTAYCDRHRLSVRQRLELFTAVCEGIQHAHQKGVIHRDIKPSNILVKLQDGEPTPKIIDFGLAKATAQRLTERTVFTEYGQLIGTPTYMSPEQAEMTALDVDTRTDIYSLGVLLYELLVGATPFDADELREAGFDEIRRRVREDEPPRPSIRLSGMGDDSATAAENRSSDAQALVKRVRGDLDWIVMKSLEKDRTRRYETANALALDVARHLRDEPVRASPPSTAYRVKKFVARHRLGVAAAALVVVALLLGIAGTTTGLIRAQRARAEATAAAERANREAEASRRVSDFLVDLFGVSDPGEARGETITARELLDRGSQRLREELAEQPLIQARLMRTVGQVYVNLSLFDEAAPLMEKALRTRERELGANHPDVADSLNALGILYMKQARYDEAEPLYRRSLEIAKTTLGPNHLDVGKAYNNIALLYLRQGKFEEAEPFCERSLEITEIALGPDHPDVGRPLTNLARLYQFRGKHDQAEPLFLRSLALWEREFGPDHPFVALALENLATLYSEQGRHGEAEPYYERSLQTAEKVLGPDHPDVARTLNNLANLHQRRGEYEKAEPLYRRSLDIKKKALGKDHPDVARTLNNLANLHRVQGQAREAEALYRQSLEVAQKSLPPDHPDMAYPIHGIGQIHLARQQFAEAEPLFERALAIRERALPRDHPDLVELRQDYATLLRATGRTGEAERLTARSGASQS